MQTKIIRILTLLFLSFSINGLCQFGFTPAVFPPASMGRTVGTIDGIGVGTFPIGTPTPSNLLEVNGGDINVGSTLLNTFNGYRIGLRYVLWYGPNGNSSNICVGLLAGSTMTTGIAKTMHLLGHNPNQVV